MPAAMPARAGLTGIPGLHRHAKAHVPKGPSIVVAANPLAVEAGMEILKKGGKAIDAAVAIPAMLGLVEPLIGIEKSPENSSREDYLERLDGAYPRARFLHVTRHPLPTVRSMYFSPSRVLGRALSFASASLKAAWLTETSPGLRAEIGRGKREVKQMFGRWR